MTNFQIKIEYSVMKLCVKLAEVPGVAREKKIITNFEKKNQPTWSNRLTSNIYTNIQIIHHERRALLYRKCSVT